MVCDHCAYLGFGAQLALIPKHPIGAGVGLRVGVFDGGSDGVADGDSVGCTDIEGGVVLFEGDFDTLGGFDGPSLGSCDGLDELAKLGP